MKEKMKYENEIRNKKEKIKELENKINVLKIEIESIKETFASKEKAKEIQKRTEKEYLMKENEIKIKNTIKNKLNEIQNNCINPFFGENNKIKEMMTEVLQMRWKNIHEKLFNIQKHNENILNLENIRISEIALKSMLENFKKENEEEDTLMIKYTFFIILYYLYKLKVFV